MRLFNQNTIKVGDFKTIEGANGETLYPNKLTEAQLNALGYYLIESQSPPNRRYYTYTEQNGVVNGKYVKGYVATERPLDEVRKLMLKDWKEHADNREENMEVTTSLGITVKANASAMQAFSLGVKRSKNYLRDKNYQKQTVTPAQMNTVLQEVEDNADVFFDLKGDKFDEIMALQTVQDCILYENTPYDYTVTQADVDADIDGNLSVGQIITRYKNNVKEW